MHTLLQQMWWRLKGNSFARVMNFMPRFVWFFFCSFVFNPCQQLTQLVTACRKKKKKKHKWTTASHPPTPVACHARSISGLFSISHSPVEISLFRQFGPWLVPLLTRVFLTRRRSVTTHSKGFFSPSKGSVQTETKKTRVWQNGWGEAEIRSKGKKN